MTDPLYTQGVQLLQSGKYDEAQRCFQQLIAGNPYNATVMNLLAICCARKEQYAQALELMEKALALDDKAADIHHNVGPIYRILGDFRKAEQHYRRAIELKPNYAEAYFNLASVKKFAADDPAIEGVLTLLRDQELSTDDRCFGHFAAGKLLDDTGQYDLAFEHYSMGNKLRDVSHSPDQVRQSFDKIIQTFTPRAMQARAGQGVPSDKPIFVVGMPRSGTTLVEQILATHPDVFGAGELRDITSIVHTVSRHVPGNAAYPDYLSDIPDNIPSGFADAYLRRIDSISKEAPRVVDKMPQNCLYLGMIGFMFPQARIVHCVRHPLDTCLSCYFQRFRVSQEYSYDLRHLGQYYRNYQRLMRHWHELLPGRIFDVQYEQLVSEPEEVTRRMLQHCDLAWNDACLEPHKTNRPVTTASNLQVRQPVYRSSVQRWRRYESHLGPLLEAIQWTSEFDKD